ncbi:hypothetical protein [Yoonia sp. R2-816]|uniref:hypothetical protein n=1 Tax=Yoonia sp. R2-816 TaxID=3342638 RepID=UPI00372B32E1
MKTQAFALLVGFLSSIFGTHAAIAQSSPSDAATVERAFIDIGYSEVSLEHCKLSYGNTVTPTDENNGFHFFVTELHLDSLKDFSDVELWRQDSRDHPTYFLLNLRFLESYTFGRTEYDHFRYWVRRNFPEANWPYQHPKYADEFAAEIEDALQNRFPELERFNRTVSHTDNGTLTLILMGGTVIGSLEETALTTLRDSLWDYSQSQGCVMPDIASSQG